MLQSRYPFMDDAYVINPEKLNLSRFYQLLRIVSKIRQEELVRQEEISLWHAWMTSAHEYRMKNDKPPSWKDWREMHGFETRKAKKSPSHVMTEEEKNALYAETMSIVAMDGKRQETLAGGKSKR